MKLVKIQNKKIIAKCVKIGVVTTWAITLLNSTKVYRMKLENSINTINTQIVELQNEQELIKQELAEIEQVTQNGLLCTLETVSCND